MKVEEVSRAAWLGGSQVLYGRLCIVEPRQPMEWRQTAPGIWTPIPDGEVGARKGPVRKIASMTAKRPTGVVAREGKTNKSSAGRVVMGGRKRAV